MASSSDIEIKKLQLAIDQLTRVVADQTKTMRDLKQADRDLLDEAKLLEEELQHVGDSQFVSNLKGRDPFLGAIVGALGKAKNSEAAQNLGNRMKTGSEPLTKGMTEFGGELKSKATEGISRIASSKIGRFAGAAKDFIFPKFADGGITTGPSIAGEKGPEAVIPLPSGGSVPVDIKNTKTETPETQALVTVVNKLTVKLDKILTKFSKSLDRSLKQISTNRPTLTSISSPTSSSPEKQSPTNLRDFLNSREKPEEKPDNTMTALEKANQVRRFMGESEVASAGEEGLLSRAAGFVMRNPVVAAGGAVVAGALGYDASTRGKAYNQLGDQSGRDFGPGGTTGTQPVGEIAQPSSSAGSVGMTPAVSPTTGPSATPTAGPGASSNTEKGAAGAYYDKMYKAIYDQAVAKGVENPEVVARLGAAQTSQETGYGKHMVGNNAFGIKGKGTAGSVNAQTQEFENGGMVKQKADFAAFNSPEESAGGYIDFLMKNPRYKGVLSAKTTEEAIAAQGKSGYATDPNYFAALTSINKKYGAGDQQMMAAGINQPPAAGVAPEQQQVAQVMPTPPPKSGEAVNHTSNQVAAMDQNALAAKVGMAAGGGRGGGGGGTTNIVAGAGGGKGDVPSIAPNSGDRGSLDQYAVFSPYADAT